MNIMKKIVITLILLSEASFAGSTMFTPVENYNGFYLGADVGLSILGDKEKSNEINSVPDSSIALKLTTRPIGGLGFVGGGVIGYDYTIYDKFKLGLEGFINTNLMNPKIEEIGAQTTTYHVKSYYNAGIRTLPGYGFSNSTVAHIILGYSNAKYTINDNGVLGIINQSMNKGGFQSGLGFKALVSENILIRLDGLYTGYGSISGAGLSSATLAGEDINHTSYQNTLSTFEVDVTLLYKFNA